MSNKQYISWTVQENDLTMSPLGYAVKIGKDTSFYPVSARHSTFERTREFEVSISGGDFVPYPRTGLTNATTNTVVRMLRNGETPNSVLMVGNDSFLYKMSLDCKEILLYKQICETNSYSIDSVSCSSDGKVWVKDNGGVVTVLNRQLNTLNTFRFSPDVIFSAIDPFRNLIWTVSKNKITSIRTEDMSVVQSVVPSFQINAVTNWDFSGPSGTFLLIVNASKAIAVATDGTITEFSSGATGICQWGAKGALACIPSAGRVDIFDGSSVIASLAGVAVGTPNPTRLASLGYAYIMVVDSSGKVVKANYNWVPQWSIYSPVLWNNIDIKTTPGSKELGRVHYITSTQGVASFRDMENEGWTYGQYETSLLNVQGSYPAVAVVPELISSHAWLNIEAIDSDDLNVRESSSSSSQSSLSSFSSQSSLSSSSSQSSLYSSSGV